MPRFVFLVAAVLLGQYAHCAASGVDPVAILPPIPASRPESPLLLDLKSTGVDAAKIDFAKLPTLPGEHAVVDRGNSEWQFRLHNYLAHHDGKFWCFWSHGPVIEDQARQHLRYANSDDGLHWSEPQVLVGPPRGGYGYIARDFWIREGELFALASLYEAPAFHDGDLELVAFRWNRDSRTWQPAGRVFDNALNNFAPERIASGEWMMSRRASDRSVSMLIGGVKAIDDWQVVPFSAYRLPGGGAPEEPHCWMLLDGAIVGLFRDNSRSGRLLRSFSTDNGRSWSPVVRTNFPDATSKFHGLRTSRGYWAMASNANPRGRHPLCLSISPDGLVFTHLFRLPISEDLAGVAWAKESRPGEPQSVQYPHVLEHEGSLYIAYSREKQTVEVVKIPLAAIDDAMGKDQ
jgi:hypothetical protein